MQTPCRILRTKESKKMKKVFQTNCNPPHISPYLKEPRRPMLNKQQAETEQPKQQDHDYYLFSHNVVSTSKRAHPKGRSPGNIDVCVIFLVKMQDHEEKNLKFPKDKVR